MAGSPPGSLLAAAAVLLLVSCGLRRCSSAAGCPDPCACPRETLLNCSSAGLSSAPRLVRDSVAELDLSRNLLEDVAFDRPRPNLRVVRLGDNGLARLSLCVDRSRNPGSRSRNPGSRSRNPGSRGCEPWAPGLQLLSVERNKLQQLPLGLEGSESLQVLQLSFNRISALRPADLGQLRQLKELHLQHNLISSLHPQTFQDSAQLRVLDLSFNLLTSLHPLTYLSLRNIGADVGLGGNRWQCDCGMRSLRRRMADGGGSGGLPAWSMQCASPAGLSGRDLLQLEEDELNCLGTENVPELHRDVTVYRGSEMLLSCAPQGSVRWTPSGEASGSQPPAGLVISDIKETDTGLYVCVSEKHEVVSVFNLQISEVGGARRKTRSLPGTGRQIIPQGTPNRTGQERNQRAAQSDLALAVCLSVFITFLIAFILGVLARPCIDVLWRRIAKKKSSSATNSVSSVEQRQYDNEAFSNGEEPEHIGTHRERRVTFSTIDYKDNNVKYYDTVVVENLEGINNDAVIECEAAERATNRAGDSGSENSLRQSGPEDSQRDASGFTDEGRSHKIDFEHIPDPVEQRRRLSSCSGSSLSPSDEECNENKATRGDHSTLESRQLAEDSVQQRADCSTPTKVEVPQLSINGKSELSGFSTEPFADWSPHTNNTNQTDPGLWQENEEEFEFSDSVRSTSARSSGVCSSFDDSKRIVVLPTFDKQKSHDSSSSSSYVSEGEQTRYTVNSHQVEEVLERNLKQDANFEQQVHDEDAMRPSVQFNQGDNRYETQRPPVRPQDSSSSLSSDSDGGGNTVKKGRVTSLSVTSHGKSLNTGAPSSPAAYSSSSSSESEAERRLNEGIIINEPETLSTDLDRQYIHQTKRRVDIITSLPASDSSSRDDSMDKTTKPTKKQGSGEVDMVGLPIKSVSNDTMKPQLSALDIVNAKPIKRTAPLPPTGSSVERAAKTTNHMQKQGETHILRLPFGVSPTGGHDPDTRWPALDLKQNLRIKRRLDIKGPSPDSSSSSDSEDETHHTEKPVKVDIAGPPVQVSQTGSHDPDTRWPALDLQQAMRIKRRLDVKAPSPPPHSSSSSDSEDETTDQIKKQKQEVSMARLPSKVSQTVSSDPQTQWPLLDLERTTRIKRRLDIKGPSPDSSSSSDSEDETTHHTERPRNVDIVAPKFQESQTGSYDPDTRWPALDLKQAMHIKRRLDIKGPSPPPDSSSSSDSEDETTDQIKKQKQEEVSMARLPSKVSQTVRSDPQTQWPLLDLERTTRIKRRLDIKGPSPDSSSSSDSEDETTHHTEKPVKVDIAGPSVQESQTGSHDPDTRWPALDLKQAMRIKRRLDIKARSPPPDSSSSSESEDETTDQIKKQKQEEMSMTMLPSKVSQTVSSDPQTQWPLLDLERTTRIKRRLDIKGPSPDSSSSSDSEDETHHTEKPVKVDIAEPPVQVSQTGSHDPDTRWPALDLQQAMRIKRRLDIKAPSPPPHSSSSSDSEDETIDQIKKQKEEEMSNARLPSKVSQTVSSDPQTQWPLLDLERTTHIKRRLDIKGPSPDSSSSIDSEDETTHHTERPRNVDIAAPKFQESQTGRYDPDTRWPALDLKQAMRIKRRLDIKGPSPSPDSSSSSDSEDETTDQIKKQKQEEVSMARLPSKVYQTVSSDPQTQWPVLDLERTTRIKRRLDIKGPSPPPDSSSTSDSEDETTDQIKKQKQEVSMARLPSKVSQTVSSDPQTQWPLLDLERTTRIKRRLDIKGPSPDSSSSSDSEDETTHHTERPRNVDIAAPKFQESQTGRYDPDTRWPALDLKQAMRIKRRLDIKGPSPSPDSSSSSDSEDETTDQIKKQKQEEVSMARLPSKVYQTVSSDPQTQWPVLDLERTTRIKRRLDIKGPSPPPDSSSTSDSEDETTDQIKKQKQEVSMARLPSKVSQTVSSDPQTQWPLLDLERTTRIKRRLDIKGPSPDSSSSSDSEDETTHHTERPRNVDIAAPKFQESQTGRYDTDTRWPALDLKEAMRIKRRLDIKGPSPSPDSSSSSDSEDETTDQIKKQKQDEVSMARLPSKVYQTVSSDPQTQWPVLDLERTTRIKRRLDIKGPSPDSSSSSDSEDETTHHTERPRNVDIVAPKFQESQTGSYDPDTRWPALDLKQAMRIKRRLDIKGPSPSPDSSSSSDSEDETTDQIKKQKQDEVSMARLPSKVYQTVSSDPQTQWPVLDLERTTRIKRRLDIKGPSPDSSSSSDSEDETTHHTERPRNVDIVAPKFQESQTGSYDPDTRWPALDLKQAMRIKRRLDIKGPSPPPDSSSTSDSEDETTDQIKKQKQEEMSMARLPSKVSQTVRSDPQTQWPVLDLEHTTRIKRRLDIKGPSPDSSSSSDSENETLNANAELGLGVSAVSKTTENEFIRLPKTPVMNTSRSPKTDHNIILEKFTVITDEVEDKTGGNMSTTPEINPELQSRWATMNLGVSRFRKRLEITSQTHEPPNLPSSPPPDSPTSSSSGSVTGSKSSRTKEKKRGVGMQGQIKTESLLTTENKPVNASLSLWGQGDISVDSVEVTERLRKDYSQPTTEGNPDTTLTGPHFRRYLDVKVNEKATPTPPLQQLPDSSSSSSENEDASIKSAGEGWRKEASQKHSSLHVGQAVNIKPDQPQNQLVQRKAELELKSQTDSVQPHLSLTNIPRIRRALDIRAQRESSPSSSSEAETKGLGVPDLSLGIPRVKRRLNVKAPLPSNSPSSCSESENDVTGSTSNRSSNASNMSGMTEADSLIAYKRVIIKTSSLPSNVFSPSREGQTTDYKQRYMGTKSVAREGPSFAPTRVPSTIFDDAEKKRTEQPRRIADVPAEIRWTGVGRQLSDLSIPSLRRHLDVGLSSPPAESELLPPDSSTRESDNTNQDKGRAEVPLMPKHLSLGALSVSPSSSRALDTSKAASEARNERKGLGALKAMSSERRKWDTIDENVATSASPRDYGLQGDTRVDHRKSGEEFKASNSRVTDLLYGIPRYRRHDIGGTEPPQGAPPPIPATPPPPSYEATGLTWRSPQSADKQSGNTEESDRSSLAFYSHFANENISEV